MAALAAALATLGSTAEARNATVLIKGFPDWLNGMGWQARGPAEKSRSNRLLILDKFDMSNENQDVGGIAHFFENA